MSLRPLAILIGLVLAAAALTVAGIAAVEPLIGGPALPYAIPAAMALGLVARSLLRKR